jgi:Ca2+-binding RTX toxin-like protein
MQNIIEIADHSRIFRPRVGALLAGAGIAVASATAVLAPTQRDVATSAVSAPGAAARKVAKAAIAGAPASELADTAWLHGGPGDDLLQGSDLGEILAGQDGNDLLEGLDGDDHLFGGDAEDLLIGGRGDDELSGNTGNDRLVGRSGNDLLTGGHGDDALEGGASDDTYLFGSNFGHDVVRERSRELPGRDVLVFEHLRQRDARIERSGDDLLVLDTQSGDSVRVEAFFSAGHRRVEALRFAGEAEASLATLVEAPRVLTLASR